MKTDSIAKRLEDAHNYAKNKERCKRRILKSSTSCERFGFDDVRYHFKDHSTLLHRKIVNEFVR